MIAFVLTAIYAIPIGIYLIASGSIQESVAAFLIPFLAALFAFIGHVIFFFIYNLIASAFGGIEFTMKDVN